MAKHDCIGLCAQLGVEALISVPSRSAKVWPNADTDAAVCEWRDRMQTEEAKRNYRARASRCELSNAHLKQHHGVAQLLVRGLEKVTSVHCSRASRPSAAARDALDPVAQHCSTGPRGRTFEVGARPCGGLISHVSP